MNFTRHEIPFNCPAMEIYRIWQQQKLNYTIKLFVKTSFRLVVLVQDSSEFILDLPQFFKLLVCLKIGEQFLHHDEIKIENNVLLLKNTKQMCYQKFCFQTSLVNRLLNDLKGLYRVSVIKASSLDLKQSFKLFQELDLAACIAKIKDKSDRYIFINYTISPFYRRPNIISLIFLNSRPNHYRGILKDPSPAPEGLIIIKSIKGEGDGNKTVKK